MEDLKIRIELDPINDGIVQFPDNSKEAFGEDVKNRKAIVIGTDGNFRTIGTEELDSIIDGLGDDSMAESLSEDYVMCFSEKSVINAEFTRYLVGSVVVVKVGRDSRVKPLTDFDIEMMRVFFEMGLITLTYGKDKFDAYPLEYEDVA